MINYIKNFLLFLILSMSITGCVSKYNDGTKNSSYKIQDKSSMYQSASLENIIIQRDMKLKKYKENSKSKKNFDLLSGYSYQEDRLDLDLELLDFYSEWEGVEYKLGGDSKNGIDCSGFTQKAFKEKFNLTMPRTTTMQSQVGKEIDKSELKSGDLVFFKIGDINHVGIFIINTH